MPALRRLWRKLPATQRTAEDKAAEQRILIICDVDDDHARKTRDNAVLALQSARLTFDTWAITGTFVAPGLDRYTCLLLCAENLYLLDSQSIQAISGFVAGGGGLVVIYRGWHRSLCGLFGIEQADRWPEFLMDGEDGLRFTDDLLPAFAGLCFGHDDISGHVPFNFVLLPSAKVFATSDGGRPLAWLNAFHRGRVLYWNSAILAEKSTRGLIVQSIGCVQDRAVLPIANIALIQIDDFPPFVEDPLREPAASEFPGATLKEFYRDIWHHDMLSLAQREGLVYSYFAIFNYGGASSDFELPGAVDPASSWVRNFDWDAGEQASRSGELGLHGYNHTPLLVERWGTSDAMSASLAACRQAWRAWRGVDLPHSYVPPNNEYDEAGVLALERHFPEIEAICGPYTGGTFERGGEREFGPEPWGNSLFAVPRATAGYEMDAGNRFEMASQMGTMGVWTHMLHPDDVFDTPEANPQGAEWRNPNTRYWRGEDAQGAVGLYPKFVEWIGFAKRTFPWLRYMDTRTAVPLLKSYLKSRFDVRFRRASVQLKADPGSFFQVRVNDLSRLNPAGISAADLVHADERDDFATYTFRMRDVEANIEFI